ncbi:hypothetical protein KKB18_03350 [bacterium]|nr:hypothetical protein [bacterium]
MKKFLVGLISVILIIAIAYLFLRHLEKQRIAINQKVMEKGSVKNLGFYEDKSIVKYAPSNSFFLLYLIDPDILMDKIDNFKFFSILVGENGKSDGGDNSLVEKGKEIVDLAGMKLKLEFIQKLLGKECFLSIYRTSDNDVDFLLLSKPSAGAKYIEKTIKAVNLLPDKVDSETINFSSKIITRIKDRELNLEFYYIFSDEMAILSSDLAMIKNVIEKSGKTIGATIFSNRKFMKIQNILGSENHGFYFLDNEELYSSIDGLFKKLSMDENEDENELVDKKNTIKDYLQSYKCPFIYGSFLIQEETAKINTTVDYSLCTEEMQAVTIHPGYINPELLKFAPSDSLITSTSNFNFKDFPESLKDLKEQIESEFVKNLVSNIEKECSSLLSDVFPNLQDHYLITLSGIDSEGIFPVPQLNVVLQFKEKPKDMKKVNELIICLISEITNQRGEVTPGQTNYKEHTISSIPIPFFSLNISYCTIDNYLVIGTLLDSVKKTIDIYEGLGNNIKEHPDFKQLTEIINKKNSTQITFYNIKEIVYKGKRAFDRFAELQKGSKPEKESEVVLNTIKAIPSLMTFTSHNDDRIEIDAVVKFEKSK